MLFSFKDLRQAPEGGGIAAAEEVRGRGVLDSVCIGVMTGLAIWAIERFILNPVFGGRK